VTVISTVHLRDLDTGDRVDSIWVRTARRHGTTDEYDNMYVGFLIRGLNGTCSSSMTVAATWDCTAGVTYDFGAYFGGVPSSVTGDRAYVRTTIIAMDN
jgi:hypothetical protein